MPPTVKKVKNTWGSNVAEGESCVITCPSGNEVEAKRVGMQGVVEAGVLGEADSLMEFVDKRHIKRVRGGKGPDRDELNMETILEDPEQLGRIMMMVDRMIPIIVMEPACALHFEDLENVPAGEPTTRRIPTEKRDPDLVYTDQIGFEDKMYVFNWSVGGTADATRFREESSRAVATVGDVEDVARPAKRVAKNKK
jgi:hypothetical protein